jgi:translation initiation factor IF-2
LSEDWGGEVPIVPISAKTGKGVDNLLEVVSLQADILDLGAAPNVAGRCYVLETQFERGRGAVATLLCQHGSVSVGDYFVCGETSGRVSSIIDSRGRKLKKVGPSLPVQISGFDELAQAGDLFEIVSKQEYRKGGRVGAQRVPGVTPLLSQESVINILIKADTDSSRGALVESIQKLSKKLGNQLSIVQSAVGLVNESDISFASTTGSMVLAFHVKVEPKAVDLAKKLTVDIRSFDIIYKLLEDLEEYAQSKQKKEVVIKKVGEAEVLKVFDIKGFGKIAGSQVKSGHFVKKGTVVVYRDGEKIGEGTIKSLQREKKTVSEVKAGYECAFTVDSFDAWQEGDRVECYAQQ